jgi:hypothetical protein
MISPTDRKSRHCCDAKKSGKLGQSTQFGHSCHQTLIVLIFVSGALALAVLDDSFRPTFGDLAKIVVSGYIGWTMPHR